MRSSLIIALAAICLATSGPAAARKAGEAQQEFVKVSSPNVVTQVLAFFGISL